MARSKVRRTLRFENLEARQLLSTGGPTDEEQYMLQLINEARTNPAAAEAQITSNLTPEVQATLQYYNVNLQAVQQTIANSTPQPPVAWNANLAAASLTQSNYMAQNQVQSHIGANGSTPLQRIQQAGYTNVVSNNENAYAYSSSATEAMEAFLIDWGVPSDGHRITIQQPGVSAQNAYRDVGIGIVQTPSNSSVGPEVVTQDFASQANEQAQLVGVAYHDNSQTNFYQPGEGQGGLQIDAVNLQTGQVASTQTWDSGGYELSLPPGQYQVIASLNDQVFQTTNVTVGNVNIEQDFVLSNPWQGGTREAAIAAAMPAAAPTPATTPTPTAAPTTTPTPTTPTPPTVTISPLAAMPTAVFGAQAPSQPASASTNTPGSLLALFANNWSAWNASPG